MSAFDFLSWRISTKLLVLFGLAALLPFTVVAGLGLLATQQLNRDSALAYVGEVGHRAETSVRERFTEAQGRLNTVLNIEQMRETLNAPLEARMRWGVAANTLVLEQRVQALLARELTNPESRLFSSAWLLTLQGIPLAPTGLVPDTLRNPGEAERILLLSALEMLDLNQDSTLVIRRGADQQVEMQYVHVVRTSAGEASGFLITQLNVEQVLIVPLARIDELNSYNFALFSSLGEVVAPPDLLRSGTIDTQSSIIEAARQRQASRVSVYTSQGERRSAEVIGHFGIVDLPNESLIVITELETARLDQRVNELVLRVSFPVVLGSFMLVLLLALLLNQALTPPLQEVSAGMLDIIRGRYDTPLPSKERGDELGGLTRTFDEMRRQIRSASERLVQRLDERARDVRVTQDISRAAVGERNLQSLMNSVVNLIVESFPTIYHAQIFLNDAENQFAVLRASTGERGKVLLERGHRLEIGSVSVIGQVTDQGQAILARLSGGTTVHRRNEFLPDTAAELAVPLRSSGRIMGALDVQSADNDGFSDDLVRTIEMLADQITIAIENVRLYEETQRLLREMETARRSEVQRAWQEYLRARRMDVIRSSAGTSTSTDFSALKSAALQAKKPIVGEKTPQNTLPVCVPIQLRGEVLGTVDFELPAPGFSYEQVLLAEELVNRLAVSLDNARLFQQSQEAAERERLINEISARMSGQTKIEDILQTAVREVQQALGTPSVAVRLQIGNGNGTAHAQQDEALHAVANGSAQTDDSEATPA